MAEHGMESFWQGRRVPTDDQAFRFFRVIF
ncbi:hypothetical protein HMPREF1484_00599 [Dermabacter sp. HFH0086]|nr:hypothetical protein HMPREF1484_00599 [Dermabacter sp. HFH0086]